jgi:hypothetical protein
VVDSASLPTAIQAAASDRQTPSRCYGADWPLSPQLDRALPDPPQSWLSAVARVIGKDSAGVAMLGSYQFVVWLTTITLALGSFGLAATTQRCMAEYLNNGNPGVARATYIAMLKLPAVLSIGAAVVGYIAIGILADAQYRAAALLLVIAIIPRLVGTIPSQANNHRVG